MKRKEKEIQLKKQQQHKLQQKKCHDIYFGCACVLVHVVCATVFLWHGTGEQIVFVVGSFFIFFDFQLEVS